MGADESVERRRLAAVVERNRALHVSARSTTSSPSTRDDVVGREENGRVLRAAVAVGEVRRVVAEDDERPSRRQRPRQPSGEPRELVGGQLEVEHRDEVEDGAPARTRARRPAPTPPRRRGSRELGCLRQRDVREVDGGHLPAALGEPDGVPPFAARDVEGAAGRQAATSAAKSLFGSAVQTSSFCA